MRVGLDLRPSLARPTGVGSYVLALAQRLPALAPDDRFFYFSASLRDRYAQKSWPKNVTLVDRRLPVKALNLDLPPAKIAATPNGVHPAFREPIDAQAVDAILARRRLPRGGLLYVGSEDKRKNLVNLAMAYMGLAGRRRRIPPLILVGPGS